MRKCSITCRKLAVILFYVISLAPVFATRDTSLSGEFYKSTVAESTALVQRIYLWDADFKNSSQLLTQNSGGYNFNNGGPGKRSSALGRYEYDRYAYTITYSWTWLNRGNSYDFSITIQLNAGWSDMQEDYNNNRTGSWETYRVSIGRDPYRGLVKQVAAQLYDLSKRYNVRFQEIALGFVQIFPYDKNNHSIARFPSEVLVDFEGNCVHHTVLLAAILWRGNRDFVFLIYPKHMSIAVNMGSDYFGGTSYRHNGKTYLLAESTVHSFTSIGEGVNPEQHGDGRASIVPFYSE